jgi:hypothetical protein
MHAASYLATDCVTELKRTIIAALTGMNPADKLARLASVVRLAQGSQSFEDYSKRLTEHFDPLHFHGLEEPQRRHRYHSGRRYHGIHTHCRQQ